ncbi:MAG: hypothetical protein E5W21_24250, partial [Mesorhizobium sp.]
MAKVAAHPDPRFRRLLVRDRSYGNRPIKAGEGDSRGIGAEAQVGDRRRAAPASGQQVEQGQVLYRVLVHG